MRFPLLTSCLFLLCFIVGACNQPVAAPKPGQLELSYSPPAANVSLRRSERGQEQDETPVTSQRVGARQTNTYELEPATYALTLRAEGYEAKELEHVAEPGVTASLEVRLEPVAASNLAPTAAFSVTPASGDAPLEVVLDASASRDADGDIVSYSWDLGDGVRTEGARVEYLYTAPGLHTVSLTVTDDEGARGSLQKTVAVNSPPSASFTAVPTGDSIPMTVTFNAAASSDADGELSSYLWDFGDGVTAEGVELSHTYKAAGAFTVTLTVTDDQGSSATASELLYANVVPPQAAFSFTPGIGTAPYEVTFDASASRSSKGDLSYLWDFGDGATAEGKIVSHTFATHGSFSVTLTVEDGEGIPAQKRETITVNGAPTARFSQTGAKGQAPFQVHFDAFGSSDPENDLVLYEWVFGDGDSAAGRNVTHTYAELGTFTVTLTVTDGAGAKAATAAQVTVGNAPPTAAFSLTPESGLAPLEVTVDADASSDPNDTLASYSWDFGDGTVKTGKRATHRYARAGTYEVSLTVTDSYGAKAMSSKQALVKNTPPVASFTLSSSEGLAPHSVTFDASTSHDPDGSVADYAWTFGDGAGAQGRTVSHVFEQAATHTVRLTVTDNSGAKATHSKSVTVAPSYRLAPLSVSNDAHTLLSGGEPFFWLGDTAWLLFSATREQDVITYLDDTASKGFNVVQVALSAAWSGNGNNSENRFGDAPYLDNDFTRPNPAYFDYVKWVIDEAAKRGLYTAITFGEPGRLADGRVKYRLESIEEGYIYGHTVGQLFSRETSQNKIIWLNGQDHAGNKGFGPAMWTAMSEGLTDGVNGVNAFDGVADYSTTFMSHHPDGCCSSSQWFGSSGWTDFSGINTWKNYWIILNKVRGDYRATPARPTVCLENSYEDHDYDGEFRTAWHVRFQGYWCVLSGSAGYAYGHANGYEMTKSSAWPGFLAKPGRQDMAHLKAALVSRATEKRVPDQSLIVSDAGTADYAKTYIVAARASGGSYALVYSTQGLSFDLDLRKLSGTHVKARWFDPREGTYIPIGNVAKGSSVAFDPPGEPGEGSDWLLVLDTLD